MLKTLLLSIVVAAAMDSSYIMIGDQTDIHLVATAEAGDRVEMPSYEGELQRGIEVIRQSKIDTTRTKDGGVEYKRDLTITSFTDSLFLIERVPFVINGETLYSEPQTLNVIQPFELDSTDAITDIKPIAKAPIWWWGILRWVLVVLLVLALVFGIPEILKRMNIKQKEYAYGTRPEPERPAEEIAMEKLDIIRDEKKWQQGKTKEYHTELTDVVREYIGRRYDVHSTEKTSDETLSEMKTAMANNKDLYRKLEKMLRLADLVKFAKWTATPEENETSLRTAYELVESGMEKVEDEVEG